MVMVWCIAKANISMAEDKKKKKIHERNDTQHMHMIHHHT